MAKLPEVREFLSRCLAQTINASENEQLNSMANLYIKNTTKTLNLLKNHLNADDFSTQYVSVYKEHVMLLSKIRELQVVLEKKHKHAKIKTIAGFGLFVTAFVPFVAVSFVSASPMNPQIQNGAENLIRKLWELPDVLKDSERSLWRRRLKQEVLNNCGNKIDYFADIYKVDFTSDLKMIPRSFQDDSSYSLDLEQDSYPS
ncbi:unnamed protein product [Arabis nemorensis]|uniref:Uncharacterized protein n=1 Tax=Arabis nemorensis TaxID=586526 RepID=A0A565B3I2_9BRAS|nr:unnamed protein product [Arabis nemorensis]